MAQRKQLTWTELRVGVFVLAALFLLMVAIFYVTGAGFLGPRYRLITYLPEVEGMKAGAPVDLDGVEVGNVQSIDLTPHPTDHEHSITLVLRVDKKFQNDIRTDSKASLVTKGLLGDRYVTISRGLTGTVIPTNGILPAEEAPDIKQVVERGADVAENLSVLSDQLKEIVSKVRRGQGTIGKVLKDPVALQSPRQHRGQGRCDDGFHPAGPGKRRQTDRERRTLQQGGFGRRRNSTTP